VSVFLCNQRQLLLVFVLLEIWTTRAVFKVNEATLRRNVCHIVDIYCILYKQLLLVTTTNFLWDFSMLLWTFKWSIWAINNYCIDMIYCRKIYWKQQGQHKLLFHQKIQRISSPFHSVQPEICVYMLKIWRNFQRNLPLDEKRCAQRKLELQIFNLYHI